MAQTAEQELIELLETSSGKKLIATHIADPDGMFTAHQFVKCAQLKEDEYVIIPLEHYLIRDPQVKKLLEGRDFYAVLDFPPVGKSIQFFSDHHISNQKIVDEYTISNRIEHSYFNVTAPSALDMLKKMAHDHFEVPVDPAILAIVNRTDTAKYETESPTTWDEFWDGDPGWRLVYLMKAVSDSPKAFNELLSKLLTSEADVLIQEHPYNPSVEGAIQRNKRIKDTAETITPKPLTIIVGNDKDVCNRNLMFRLYDGVCKVCVVIANNGDDTYRIGFGTALEITDDELEPYRCDKLAEELGGGGHARASGCGCLKSDLERVIMFIQEHFKHLECGVVRLDQQ